MISEQLTNCENSYNYLQIDSLNEKCYSLLAEEYSSESHTTCRNFDFYCEQFFIEISEKLIKRGSNIIDVGTGNGAVIEFLRSVRNDLDISALDLSKNMIKACKIKLKNVNYINESIFFYKSKRKYDAVTASMADPFLLPETVCILKGLTEINGHIMLTLPAFEWAKAVRVKRNSFDKARFRTSNGKEVESFSFCYPKSVLERMFSVNGLTIVCSVTYPIGFLKTPSQINRSLMDEHGKKLPYLYTIVAKNEK